MKLNKLFLNNFRGASQPVSVDFEPSKKITMLFGENGNGKSSIADALVCLCTDKLGSISDKSSIDKEFIRTLGSNSKDVQIQLLTDKGLYTAKLNSTGSSFVKKPDTNLPTVRHLRRSQIISLIDSEPSKRYDALKDYIDISNIIKCEDELRKANKNANIELSQILRVISNAELTIKAAWEAEGKPESSFKEWAKNEADKDITQQQALYNDYTKIVNSWRGVEAKRSEVSKTSKKYKSDAEAENTAVKNIEELKAKDSELNDELLIVLVEAKKFIASKTSIGQCPVCEQPIIKDKLIGKLTAQINSMNEFETAQKAFNEIKKTKDQTESTLKIQINSFIEELDEFIIGLESIIAPSDSLLSVLQEIKDGITDNEKYKALNKGLTEITSKIALIESELIKIQKSINQHNLIKGHYNNSVVNRQKHGKTKNLCDYSEKALSIVESTRKQFIEDELISISADIESFYQKMHPAEQLGGIKLFLKPNVKNSIELNADFYSKASVTPQSLYSESHLDTLGICIFLALAKKYNDGNTILILDDVVMSVDENHLDRFIELLHNEADNFAHILITTHYRPWKDRYRFSRAPSHQVHFVELKAWNLSSGIRFQNSKIDIEELKMALDASHFDRQRVSNLAGTILENVLDFLSVKYQCKLPRKPKQEYVLRELLDCLSKNLLKAMKVQHLVKNILGKYEDSTSTKEVELKPMIDELKQLSVIRNQVGAHFNFDGSMFSDKDVKEFADKTYEFAALLICPEAGNFPDRSKSGSYHETRSGSIRLHPLIEPS